MRVEQEEYMGGRRAIWACVSTLWDCCYVCVILQPLTRYDTVLKSQVDNRVLRDFYFVVLKNTFLSEFFFIGILLDIGFI